MKYFKIQDSPELKYAPQIKNWYGSFDVRDIRIDRFYKLPKMQLFPIEPSENLIFTDIILFPFLLVSPMVYDVIQMYRERCFFRKVILADQVKRESRLYYLPVLDETSQIRLESGRGKEGLCVDRNLFWVRDTKKRHIIMSMDMAESLIRREVTGLGLCEVTLWDKEGKEKES